MKPTWDKAPKWAKWLAMDSDGKWYWHRLRPIASRTHWVSMDISEPADNRHWESTLEKMPEVRDDQED